MEVPIEDTVAEQFKKKDKITLKTPGNGDIKGEIYSIGRSNSETYIQVTLTPPITRLDESELSRQHYKLDKIERSGSVAIDGPPLLSGIQLIYDSESGRYKEKNDNWLKITTIQFPKIEYKIGGKKHRKTNKRKKSNKRNTKYSKYVARNLSLYV